MKNNLMSAVLATSFLMVCTQAVEAGVFSVAFKWGKIPQCNDGFPGTVQNPIFTLSKVPSGTKKIVFEMEDLDYSSVQDGGAVTYTGQKVIEPGAFKWVGRLLEARIQMIAEGVIGNGQPNPAAKRCASSRESIGV